MEQEAGGLRGIRQGCGQVRAPSWGCFHGALIRARICRFPAAHTDPSPSPWWAVPEGWRNCPVHRETADPIHEQLCTPSLRPPRPGWALSPAPPAGVPTACHSIPVTLALRRGDQACRFKHPAQPRASKPVGT